MASRTETGFSLDYRVTDFFFDEDKLDAFITKGEQKAMSRIGAFVRQRMRQILRRRKKVSAVGQTPSVHSNDKYASLKNILFSYDRFRHNVAIGPVKLNQVNMTDSGSKTVPQILEEGGTVTIHEFRYKARGEKPASQWFRRDLRRALRPWQEARTRTARYGRRPFASKALEMEIAAGTVTDAWRASMAA